MGFKFTDRICNIEINERVYPVVFQKPLIDRLGEAKGLFSGLKGSGDSKAVCEAFDRGIDMLLGDGSAAAIFAERFPDITERYAVLRYIYDELTAFMQKISGEKNVLSKAENAAH